MDSLGGLLFLVLAWAAIVKVFDWRKSFVIGAILFLWFGVVVVLGKKELFAANPLFAPNIFLGFLLLFELLRRTLASKSAEFFVERVSIPWITAIQTYRIVGVVFFSYWQAELLPAHFAFPAGIGDIVVGLTAPIVALLYYLKKSYAPKLVQWWNILGITDLAIAIGVGFLAFGKPAQFLATNPSTEILSLYPLVVVPLFAVPLAIVFHIIGLRALKVQKPSTSLN